ncbi:MAG: twin-arginine translocation signal domain-containing protein, partial [Thermomicrobiales bacterium]|nr:twin-arginine translocation signal domain-containing protein [Thermomicrobiales bacterium]
MPHADLTRSRLDRRDLLKLTGAAASVAALGGLGAAASPQSAFARQDTSAIIFGVGTDVDELDPRTTDTQEGYIACANVYDCLVLYELGATTLRPGLAESWEISDDGLEYTFTLRQGVKFHDGADFNADAVV